MPLAGRSLLELIGESDEAKVANVIVCGLKLLDGARRPCA